MPHVVWRDTRYVKMQKSIYGKFVFTNLPSSKKHFFGIFELYVNEFF